MPNRKTRQIMHETLMGAAPQLGTARILEAWFRPAPTSEVSATVLAFTPRTRPTL